MMVGFLEDTAGEEVAGAGSLAGNRCSSLLCHYNCCAIGLGHHTALEEQQAVPGPAGSSLQRS